MGKESEAGGQGHHVLAGVNTAPGTVIGSLTHGRRLCGPLTGLLLKSKQMWPCAMLALFLQSAATPTVDWQAQGLKALDGKNYPAAIEALSKATAGDPKDFTAHFNLALAYSLADRDTEAIAEYRKTLELKPGLYQANLNLGILLLRDKQFAAAADPLQQSQTAKPTEFRPAYYLAEALSGSGHADQAIPFYESAVKLQPDSAPAHAGLARALLQQNRAEEAAVEFDKAAKLDASYSNAVLELADWYERNKKNDEAVTLYSRFPENAAAQERAGELLREAGRTADSIPYLERSVQRSPTAANRLALATAYVDTKQAEKAAQLLTQALTADPRDFELRMVAGRLLRSRKQYAASIQQFLQAATVKPDSVEAWNDVASSAILAENYPQAMAALDKVKELGAEKPSHLYLRAIMLDKLMQLKPALAYYQQFLAASGGKMPEEEFKSRQRARIIQQELNKR